MFRSKAWHYGTSVKLTRLVFFSRWVKNSLRGLANTFQAAEQVPHTETLFRQLTWTWVMGRVQPSFRGLGVPGKPQAPPQSTPSLWDSKGLVWCIFWPLALPWGSCLSCHGGHVWNCCISLSCVFLLAFCYHEVGCDQLFPGERKAFTALEYYADRYGIPHPREGMKN